MTTVRFQLKSATDDVHRELDGRLSRLDLSDAADYRRFLRLQARAVPAVESSLDCGGLPAIVGGWAGHRRSEALAADLAALGEPMPAPAPAPSLSSVEELLGTAYVLEGSRLGGRVLRRQVGDGLPTRFLASSDAHSPWIDVIAAMDRLLYSEDRIGEATQAARRCFALFLSVAAEDGI